MKKTIALIALGLGLTISASAQNSKKIEPKKEQAKQLTAFKSPEIAAENDVTAYAKFLNLDETQKQDAKRLFIMKHKIMQDKNNSAEKKKQFSKIVEAKIAASIDSNQLEKLKADKALYEQLINGYNL